MIFGGQTYSGACAGGSARAHLGVRFTSRLAIATALISLAACGGGGGGGMSTTGSGNGSGGGGVSWTAGVFQPSSGLAAQCVAPRSGTDPGTGSPFPDRQGTVASENNWLRSWTNDLYLWFDQVPDDNPNNTTTAAAYFDLMKTTATTTSGNPRDKFHFTMATAAWEALAQSGVSAGYGAQWVIVAQKPPRRVVVAYTEANSPATDPSANLSRGVEVVTVDGVDVVNDGTQSGVATLNAGLFPTAAGQMHTFGVRDLGSSVTRTITMQSATVTSKPVQNVQAIATASGPVGYMLFNDHLATAESAFINGINTLKAANVTDLILDIRYNGGGLLDIADEVAFMIAGAGPTAGRTFERTVFNSKHPTTDPVTGKALAPIPFHTTTQGFSTTSGQPLPTLNLPRVYVLTGSGTCSASESIINSLRGVNLPVIQIGSTTCGKPYGFYPQDNCGTTYFSIEFQGVNDQGFGTYPDGFSPMNTTPAAGVQVPGCSVADDFTKPLGDPNEGRLAAALAYRTGSTCPAPSGFAPQRVKKAGADSDNVGDGLLHRSPWRENRILRE
jgi:carboxyl-terminal processing protease